MVNTDHYIALTYIDYHRLVRFLFRTLSVLDANFCNIFV